MDQIHWHIWFRVPTHSQPAASLASTFEGFWYFIIGNKTYNFFQMYISFLAPRWIPITEHSRSITKCWKFVTVKVRGLRQYTITALQRTLVQGFLNVNRIWINLLVVKLYWLTDVLPLRGEIIIWCCAWRRHMIWTPVRNFGFKLNGRNTIFRPAFADADVFLFSAVYSFAPARTTRAQHGRLQFLRWATLACIFRVRVTVKSL